MGSCGSKINYLSGLWIVFLLGLLCANQAGAKTLAVPAEYGTIQAAVNAATTGDTIQIADGTYTGAGNTDIEILDKDITVRGNPDKPGQCIIDCQGTADLPHRGFVYGPYITPNSHLDGLTIRGGYQSSGAGALIHGNPEISNCIFNGNSADYGAAIMIYGKPTIINCTFIDNSAIWGGGIIIYNGSPVIDKCLFTTNKAFSSGGGICMMGGMATINRCNFSDNSADIGAGVYVENSRPKLTNCTFSDNIAGWGGGIYSESGSNVVAANCTFTRNTAIGDSIETNPGGAIFISGSTVDLTNCILWGDTGSEIGLYGTNTVNTNNNIVQGGYAGNGNINADPLFVDESNLRLKPHSPGIDKGDNSIVNAPPFMLIDGAILDMDGNPRIINNTADIGAYETENADAIPPVLTLPANMIVAATGTSGAIVTYSVSAADSVDGSVAVSCSPASGTRFPLGITTVKCTATDSSGNTVTGSFTVTVKYLFKGFLSPIKSRGSVFKQGCVIPVRFQLPNPKGGFIANAAARIYVTKLADSSCASSIKVNPACRSAKGNLFYYEKISKQYIYLLNTSAMSTGTWQIRADLGDGNPNNTVTITIDRGRGRR